MACLERNRLASHVELKIGMPREERIHLIEILLRLVGTGRVDKSPARGHKRRNLIKDLCLKLHERGDYWIVVQSRYQDEPNLIRCRRRIKVV